MCSCDPRSLGGRSRKVKFETSLEFLAWKETDRDRDKERDRENSKTTGWWDVSESSLFVSSLPRANPLSCHSFLLSVVHIKYTGVPAVDELPISHGIVEVPFVPWTLWWRPALAAVSFTRFCQCPQASLLLCHPMLPLWGLRVRVLTLLRLLCQSSCPRSVLWREGVNFCLHDLG